jgi:hypothetical protein
MVPFRQSGLQAKALNTQELTISLPAAALFLSGAVVTWILFDTEPPADDLRSLVGFFGFVAMAAGCALQGRRMLTRGQANAPATTQAFPLEQPRRLD